ncbi:MAG TPA: ribulokinase [Saprospiraceae bacterium]|mgnify:CR=1 FL=1|nr:ribulokinase [Saprospiraceae bacterium]
MKDKYVIGLDFGTDSVRAMVVNAMNGEEKATSVSYYPRWKSGLYCNPAINQFRQHPLDYLEGLEECIIGCVEQIGCIDADKIVGLSLDTTGSTPVAVDSRGIPLSFLPEFKDNENSMFILWKDHTAVNEADEINKAASTFETNYLKYTGGIYSSEWFWAKLLYILRMDKGVRNRMSTFVELCDWIPFVLTGGNDASLIKRGVCSAGHKALWAEEFGGLPSNDFFAACDPLLDGWTSKLFSKTFTSDQPVGKISPQWAEKLRLPENVIIGIGAFDCHIGAVGGQIEPFYLSKILGTSTCDIMVAPLAEMKDKIVPGLCGQVNGSVIPGMTGIEAGQSAFGDVYAWFKEVISWPVKRYIRNENEQEAIFNVLLEDLSKEASMLHPTESDALAMDWLNGRRTPDANQRVKGAFTQLNLGTGTAHMFKALVEATCFGSKAIVERFKEERISIEGIIALGGVAKKSPYIMQVMADVLEYPIKVHRSEQTCALGAAMFAATAAGIYPKVEDAMEAMGAGFEKTYIPNKSKTDYYQERFRRYKQLGDFINQQF